MNKVSVLVDGFNLYHSIKDIQRDHDRNLRWLDIRSLCSSYLHLISKDATIENIYYFTAFAIHLNDSSVISRHRNYIECLQDTGIIVEYGRFKPKSITCSNCHSTFIKHEEKETDVRIATKVCHLLAKNECDTILLVTGDTDLSPSIEHARQCYPGKTISFAFPYRRVNDELRVIAPGSFKIKWHNYAKHQLPDPYLCSDGTYRNKPLSW